MLDRYGCPRALSRLAVAATLLALAAPTVHAQAQGDAGEIAVPADAPTVATTPSGAAILAWNTGGRTCMVVQKPGAPRPTRIDEDVQMGPDAVPASCDSTPVPSRFSGQQWGTSAISDTTDIAWGHAGLDTAKVIFKRAGKVVAESVTGAPGVLPAPAGDLRFWAIDLPRAQEGPDEVALADAAGVVRRAVAPSAFATAPGIEGDESGGEAGFPLRPHGRRLQGGRIGNATWGLWTTAHTVLAPTPLLPERTETQQCLSFVVQRAMSGAQIDGICDDRALRDEPLYAVPTTDCTVGVHVDVLVSAAVRRVVVVLGDGTRRRVPLARISEGRRAGTVIVGTGMAIRRADALAADGRPLTSQPIGLAPTPPSRGLCHGGIASLITSAGVVHAPTRLRSGAHVVRAVDHGIELCAALDAAPRVPDDCGLPPVDPTDAGLVAHATPSGRYVFGLVPAEVAAARIVLTDRTTRTVAAVPLAGYTGIYAGTVAQITADVPGPHAVERIQLLDDRGRVVSRWAGGGDPTAVGRAVTVLAAAQGVPAIRAAPLQSSRFAATCLAFGTLDGAPGCFSGLVSGSGGAETVTVRAQCAPRRLVVWAILRHRDDRLVVRTTRGREVTARRVRFPAGAGPAAKDKLLAVAVLGPRDGAATALVRGRAARRVPIGLPSAARQCGYEDTPGALIDFMR